MEKKNCEKCAFYFHNVRSVNVKDVWFDSYDEEGTLRSLAWTESLVTKRPQRLGGLYIC